MISKIAVLLVGGYSTRMGKDKFLMDFNGQPQWEFMVQQLNSFFDEVFISCRADQAKHFEGQKVILDEVENIGPMGAIYSSFRSHTLRDCSLRSELFNSKDFIFFVACDLPNFDISLSAKLHKQLSPNFDVVAAFNQVRDSAEPLVAFWNRSAITLIEKCIAEKNYALFRCMSKLRVHTVEITDASLLLNVNSPNEL